MIKFSPVKLEDKRWVGDILAKQSFYTCEYTFGNIFSYTAMFPIEIARVGGCLISKCHTDEGISYCYPIGEGDKKKAVEYILKDAADCGNDFELFGIDPQGAKELAENFPERFDIFLAREDFDYIYLSEDLISLKGKKYQPKRNHISYFKRNFSWSYERISAENIPECLQMSESWLSQQPEERKEALEQELLIIKKIFSNYDTLGYVGGLLRVDGKVVAYTMGERMTDDMFCTHIEKAFSDIRGAYPMINQLFAENELSHYKYIDREDDVGEENLRKAKLSYYPVILFEKYVARLKNAH